MTRSFLKMAGISLVVASSVQAGIVFSVHAQDAGPDAGAGATPAESPGDSSDPGPGSPAPPATTPDAGADASPPTLAAFQAPDLPAMALINADVSNVDRPGSVRDFGAAVANLVTPDGKVRSGVSVEVTPRAFGFTRNMSAFQYRHDWGAQFVSRLALSIATAAETAVGTMMPETRFAVGLRLVFWNEADPLLDVGTERVREMVTTACASRPSQEQPACEQDASAQAYKDVASGPAHWNLGGATLATAVSSAFANGNLSSAAFDQVAVWGNVAFPLGDWGQIAVSGRFRWHDSTQWDAGGFARLRVGIDGLRVIVEGGLLDTRDATTNLDGAAGRFSLGAEIRLGQSTWLSLGIGANVTRDTTTDQVIGQLFALSNLQWSLNDAPTF